MNFSFGRRSVGAKVAFLTSGALLFVAALVLSIFSVLDVSALSQGSFIRISALVVGLLVFVEVVSVIVAVNHFVSRPVGDLEEKAAIIESTNQKLEASLRDLSVLYHTLNILSHPLEQSELLHTISRLLPEVVSLKKFSLAFVADSKDELVVLASHGFKDALAQPGARIRMGEGVIGAVARDRKMSYLTHALKESRDLFSSGEKGDIGSFISIPLAVADEVIGVLSVGHEAESAYTLTDIQLLESIGNQIALAYDRSKLYMKTKELSVRDELTGIYNRRHFQEMLHMEWKRTLRFERPLALLMIDVDYFKDFNDHYGHLQGDEALKRIAKLLLENVREVDTVARFGGEEFVILLADTNLTEAMYVAEKLRQLIAQDRMTLSAEQSPSSLSVSIGVSAYPDYVSNEEELISTADIALYQAKAGGRNRVDAYSPSLGESPRMTKKFESGARSTRIAS